jgi:hypothetical protein
MGGPRAGTLSGQGGARLTTPPPPPPPQCKFDLTSLWATAPYSDDVASLTHAAEAVQPTKMCFLGLKLTAINLPDPLQFLTEVRRASIPDTVAVDHALAVAAAVPANHTDLFSRIRFGNPLLNLPLPCTSSLSYH